MENEKKKIIVDEDWKSQVEAEREELAKKQQGTEEPAHLDVPEHLDMPEASFGMLLTTLATEAMVGLGQIPYPGSDQPQPNLDQAKYFIDTLEVLQEKTKGNLTPDEEQGLTTMLYQLRLAFVSAQKASPTSTPIVDESR